MQSLPGAGIANVRGIEEGKADIGFGNSISTVDALTGAEPFKKPHDNVCNIATFYPQYYQMVVLADSGVNSVKDLKGKAISTQPRGNTGEVITGQLLKVYGLSYNDVKMSFVSYTDSVTQMQDGHAHAFGLGTTIPAGAIMDLASARADQGARSVRRARRHAQAQSRLQRSSRSRRAPIRSRSRTPR